MGPAFCSISLPHLSSRLNQGLLGGVVFSAAILGPGTQSLRATYCPSTTRPLVMPHYLSISYLSYLLFIYLLSILSYLSISYLSYLIYLFLIYLILSIYFLSIYLSIYLGFDRFSLCRCSQLREQVAHSTAESPPCSQSRKPWKEQQRSPGRRL